MTSVIKKALRLWWWGEPASSGAALAFYALFALPPILIVVAYVANYFLLGSLPQGASIEDLQFVFGKEASNALTYIVGDSYSYTSFVVALISLCTVLISCIGIFSQLQLSLNKLWAVGEVPSGFQSYILNQVVAFLMLFLLGLLLIASLVASTLVSIFDRFAREQFSYAVDIVQISDTILSFVLVAFLCMTIFEFLPHIRISRKAIIAGGIITALLFFVGRIFIGLYLSTQLVGSAYETAGALIVVMLWVYYSSQVFLFGAALTYSIDQKVKLSSHGHHAQKLG
jgi:membrane protein